MLFCMFVRAALLPQCRCSSAVAFTWALDSSDGDGRLCVRGALKFIGYTSA